MASVLKKFSSVVAAEMKRDIPDLGLDKVVAGVDRGKQGDTRNECTGEGKHLNESGKRLWVQAETERGGKR